LSGSKIKFLIFLDDFFGKPLIMFFGDEKPIMVVFSLFCYLIALLAFGDKNLLLLLGSLFNKERGLF
jgi:hypothetical protein